MRKAWARPVLSISVFIVYEQNDRVSHASWVSWAMLQFRNCPTHPDITPRRFPARSNLLFPARSTQATKIKREQCLMRDAGRASDGLYREQLEPYGMSPLHSSIFGKESVGGKKLINRNLTWFPSPINIAPVIISERCDFMLIWRANTLMIIFSYTRARL